MPDRNFQQQLKGYGLTTAEILYRLPDHPALIQSFVWQDYDLVPRFPRLHGFLEYWSKNLEGQLYKIRVAHKGLISPAEWRLVDASFKLN